MVLDGADWSSLVLDGPQAPSTLSTGRCGLVEQQLIKQMVQSWAAKAFDVETKQQLTHAETPQTFCRPIVNLPVPSSVSLFGFLLNRNQFQPTTKAFPFARSMAQAKKFCLLRRILDREVPSSLVGHEV